MKHTLKIITVIFTCLLASVGSVHAAEPAKPNIVYILTDDLGYGDVKCLGGERCKIPTPNIDKLASQGMIFTEAHSSSSVCTPTRYGILTGRYNWRSTLQRSVLRDLAPPLIAADRLTVPSFLKQYGYSTAAIGKWHLGYNCVKDGDSLDYTKPITDGPTTRGFDYYFGSFMSPHHSIENDRVIDVSSLLPPSTAVGRKAERLDKAGKVNHSVIVPLNTDKACEYINKQAKSGSPFFLYFAMTSPHTPIAPTAEWEGKSGLNSAYLDYVMETDAMVGRVMETLEKNGMVENTLVIFTSDNGCNPKPTNIKSLEAKGHFPSGLRRGYKSDIWDGGHHIPFIARWPGKVKAGSRSDEIICLTDLMATSAEILGAKLPETAGVDSVSILPVLLGTAKTPIREAVVHHSIDGKFAIRQGQWKLELCQDSGGWGKDAPVKTPGQLYDMSKDVGERTNEYAEQPEIVSRLTKLLEKYVADGRSTAGPAQKNDVPVDIWKKNSKDKIETE